MEGMVGSLVRLLEILSYSMLEDSWLSPPEALPPGGMGHRFKMKK